MWNGGGGVGRTAAQGYEDGDVEENSTEHGDEYPKVMEPETLRLVGFIDPAL